MLLVVRRLKSSSAVLNTRTIFTREYIWKSNDISETIRPRGNVRNGEYTHTRRVREIERERGEESDK